MWLAWGLQDTAKEGIKASPRLINSLQLNSEEPVHGQKAAALLGLPLAGACPGDQVGNP